jgi:hypothetical protein
MYSNNTNGVERFGSESSVKDRGCLSRIQGLKKAPDSGSKTLSESVKYRSGSKRADRLPNHAEADQEQYSITKVADPDAH